MDDVTNAPEFPESRIEDEPILGPVLRMSDGRIQSLQHQCAFAIQIFAHRRNAEHREPLRPRRPPDEPLTGN